MMRKMGLIRTLSLILVMALAAACLPVGVQNVMAETIAETIPQHREVGDPYTVEGGVILFNKATGTVTGYQGEIDNLTIPEVIDGATVVRIGPYAFCNGVWEDGALLYVDRNPLSHVFVPKTVTEIAAHAFNSCDIRAIGATDGVALGNYYPVEALKKIGPYAFYDCYYLEFAGPLLGMWLEEIGDYAFANCMSLFEAMVHPGLMYLGDFAFSHSGIQFANFTYVGDFLGTGIFSNCWNLRTLFVDSSIIPPSTFANCESLSDVQLPYANQILPFAFAGCSALGELTVPSSVNWIDGTAFLSSESPSASVLPNLVFRVSPSSYAEEYAIQYHIPYVYDTGNIRASLMVSDENSTALTDGYTVNWYERGNPAIVATGSSAYLADGKLYDYEVVLEEALGSVYLQPGRAPLDLSGGGEIAVALQRIPAVLLTGRVADTAGIAIPGAAIRITQRANGQFPVLQTVYGGDDGSFSVSVLKTEATVAVSAGGYINQTLYPVITDETPDTVDLGTVVLQQLANRLITISMAEREAALPGEAGQVYGLYTFDGLAFSLFNVTKNRAIAPIVQYPYLVLDGEPLSIGDEIEITVTDGSGKMTAPPVSVEIDGDLNGFADISFVDNGYFTAMAREGLAMVFDATGAFVSNIIHSGMVKGEPLAQGNYTVVFLDRTPMLMKVLHIEKLAEMGLVSGVDYASMPVGVTNGTITALDGVSTPVLDVDKLLYTKSALFSVNKQTIGIDAFAIYRLEYELDQKHNPSAETLTVEFPAHLDLVANSVTLDGRITSYTYVNRVLTVMVNKPGGILRFCAEPSLPGAHFLSGFLSFQSEGGAVAQPLGQATVNVEEWTIHVPEITSLSQVNVYGKAPAGAQVTIYDSGVIAGHAVANGNGEWLAPIELYRPYAYSYHNIYAVTENQAGVRIQSEEEVLIHNIKYKALSKVTMYNKNWTTEINFSNPTAKKPVYTYDPNYQSFTFVAEFEDPDTVDDKVDIVVTGFDDVTRSFPMTYDANRNAWVGTANLDLYSSPKSIGVVYATNANAEVQYDRRQFADMRDEIESVLDEADIDGEELKAELAAAGIQVNVIKETLAEGSNGLSGDYITRMDYNDGTDNVSLYNQFSVSAFTGNADNLLNEGYDCVPGADGGKMYVKMMESDSEMLMYIVDAREGTLTVSGATTYDPTMPRSLSRASNDIPISAMVKVISTNLFTLMNKFGFVFSAISLVDSTADMFNIMARRDNLAKWIKNNCCISESVKTNCLSQLTWLAVGGVTVGGGSFVTGSLGTMWGITCVVGGVALEPALVVGSAFVAAGIGLGLIQASFSSRLDEIQNRAIGSAIRLEAPCCPFPTCCGKPDKKEELDRAVDPSGYVYEAVLSNRLEGVAATVYRKPMDAGPDDLGELWDAGDYWQENPLFTDAEGLYAWDVPWGQWQVRFEKSGYENAESEWLPVPPPQVDINVGMVSRAAPAVDSVKGYEDYIEIVFAKYMDIGTLTTGHMALTGYGGGYSITFADAEQDPLTPGLALARTVRIIPAGGSFTMGGTYGVQISTAAKSYAGVGLANAYHADVTIVPEPKSITGADELKVNYGTARTLQVAVIPAQAGANQMVTAVSTSPYIAAVSGLAITDENGVATFNVTGELPGTAEIVVKLEDSQLSKTVAVAVGLPGETAVETYTVTFDPNGGTRTGGGALVQTVSTGGAAAAPTVSRDGYAFNGWDQSFDNVSADITVKAQWTNSSSGNNGRPPYIPPFVVGPEPPPQVWLNPYNDVADTDWFYEAVRFVTGNDLMSGTGNHMFSPSATITRAMIVTVLYRVEGKPEVQHGDLPFTDVAAGEWYSDAILWASQNAIVLGYANGTFGLNDPVTREQVVTVLYRYARAKGLDVSAAADLSKYADMDEISDWALDAMKWAVAVGIVQGRTATTTVPKGATTRAEVAMLLKRFIEDARQ